MKRNPNMNTPTIKSYQRRIGAIIVDLGDNTESDGSRIILGASDWAALSVLPAHPNLRRDFTPGTFGGTAYYFVP